jgi:hypothetical protein
MFKKNNFKTFQFDFDQLGTIKFFSPSCLTYFQTLNHFPVNFNKSSRNYFTLLYENLPLDEFMDDYYEKLVPSAYTPEPSVVEGVLKAVDVNGGLRHLPRIWSDMILFDHVNRQNLVEAVADLLAGHADALPGSDSDPGLAEKLVVVANDLFARVERQSSERSSNMVR